MLFDQKYAVRRFGKAQRNEGREEGREEGMLEVLIRLVRNGLLSVSDAAAQVSMPASEFQTLMETQQA
ncbi:MAG: hypothetical protein IKP40_00090 [Clostridia bacterium]|nr:hypothetical protein [Clostridia bacterium]